MTDLLMTGGSTGEPLGIGSGLAVSGAVGSKVLGASPCISLATVAGESITAGDVVGSFRKGIRKGFGLLAGAAETKLVDVAISNDGGYECPVCALNSSSYYIFVLGYRKAADSKLYARALQVNDDWTITIGAEVTVANYAVNAGWKPVGVDATTFAICWVVGDANTNGRLAAGTVNTATLAITMGAEATFHPNQTGRSVGSYSGYAYNMALYATSSLIIAYSDGQDSNYGHVVCATIAGTTVTVDTAHDLKFSGTSAVDDISIAAISSTKAIIYYEVGTALYKYGVSISGTTPSGMFAQWGPVASVAMLGSAAIGGQFLTLGEWMVVPDDIWVQGGAAGACITGHGMNYGPSYGSTSYILPYMYTVYAAVASSLSPFAHGWSSYFIGDYEGNNSALYARLCKWDAYTMGAACITSTLVRAVASGNYGFALSADRTMMFYTYTKADGDNKAYAVVYDVGYPVGLAQAANTGGAALNIMPFGNRGVSTVQSGLIKGKWYYATAAGALQTTPNGWKVGRAESATAIYMGVGFESF